MRRFLGSVAVAFAALALWPCIARAEGTATCPERIETEQRLRTPVEGFEAVNARGNYFWSGIVFYEGRPEKMIALKYDSEADDADGGYALTWKLDPKTEYWIECQYGSTSVTLAKKLPPVSECKVSTSAAQEMAMVCR